MRYQKPFCYFPLSEDEAENVLYVTTCNPVALYFMNVSSKNGSFVDFYDLFPRTVGNVWQPFVTVAPLGNPLKGQVLVHEEQVKKKTPPPLPAKTTKQNPHNQQTTAKSLLMS